MATSINLQPDPRLERKLSPSSCHPDVEVQPNGANRVEQLIEFPEAVANLTPITISCPRNYHREVGIVGMQATLDEIDKKGRKDIFGWDSDEGIVIPDAVVSRNPTGEYLRTLESIESRTLPGEVAGLQFDVEHPAFKDDLILPQSPLGLPILMENEDPPSPSTTVVDDESISSDITSVDPCPLDNRTFPSAKTAKFKSLGTEAAFYTSQETLHPQAYPETSSRGKKHQIFGNGEAIFTDPSQYYYDTFAIKLRALNSINSENSMCIERFLAQSEAEWFSCVRRSRLELPGGSGPGSFTHTPKLNHQNTVGEVQFLDIEQMNEFVEKPGRYELTSLRRVLLIPIRDFWPVYSLLIALVRMKPY